MSANYTTPNRAQPMVDSGGMASLAWWQYLWNLSPANVQPDSAITVTASPFAYTANARGTVLIDGGTVSSVTLNRTGTAYTISPITQVFMARGDVITVTYSVAPTMAIFPI